MIFIICGKKTPSRESIEKTHNRRINADNVENINKRIPGESSVSIYLLPKKKFAKSLRQIWIKE
jgi:hypothetical protein